MEFLRFIEHGSRDYATLLADTASMVQNFVAEIDEEIWSLSDGYGAELADILRGDVAAYDDAGLDTEAELLEDVSETFAAFEREAETELAAHGYVLITDGEQGITAIAEFTEEEN